MPIYCKQLAQLKQRNDLSFEEFLDCSQNQVIIAGPGSGKTQCLLLKAATLFNEEIRPPQGLACLTYSRKLARELKIRLRGMWLADSQPNLFTGTLHAFCLTTIVAPFAEKLDFPLPNPLQGQIRIASEEEKQQALNKARSCTEISYINKFSDKNFADYRNSVYLDQQLRLGYDEKHYNKDMHRLIRCYERNLLYGEPPKLDFELLIRAALKLLITEELVRETITARFPWILVDEYQDLGYPLHRLITILTERTPIKSFVIGDPLQCIYQFQGAKPDYLKSLHDKWPSIRLTENYRSSRVVLQASQTIVNDQHQDILSGNTGYCHVINCPHQNQVVTNIVREIIQLHSIPADQITILARRRDRLLHISNMLNDLPHRILSHPQYKTHTYFVSWLELAATWCSIGWKEDHVDFEDIFRDYLNLYQCDQTPLSEEEAFGIRVELYRTLSQLCQPEQKLYNWLNDLEDKLQLKILFTKFEKILPDDLSHYEKIKELVSPNHSLQELTVDKFGTSVKRLGEVTLNTIHGSKGDENSIVIVIGDGQLTKDTDRNLLYVAMTRAKFGLFLIYPEQGLQELVDEMNGKDGFKYEKLASNIPELSEDFSRQWKKYSN